MFWHEKIVLQFFVDLHLVFERKNIIWFVSVLQALYFYQIDGRGPCLAFEGIAVQQSLLKGSSWENV